MFVQYDGLHSGAVSMKERYEERIKEMIKDKETRDGAASQSNIIDEVSLSLFYNWFFSPARVDVDIFFIFFLSSPQQRLKATLVMGVQEDKLF